MLQYILFVGALLNGCLGTLEFDNTYASTSQGEQFVRDNNVFDNNPETSVTASVNVKKDAAWLRMSFKRSVLVGEVVVMGRNYDPDCQYTVTLGNEICGTYKLESEGKYNRTVQCVKGKQGKGGHDLKLEMTDCKQLLEVYEIKANEAKSLQLDWYFSVSSSSLLPTLSSLTTNREMAKELFTDSITVTPKLAPGPMSDSRSWYRFFMVFPFAIHYVTFKSYCYSTEDKFVLYVPDNEGDKMECGTYQCTKLGLVEYTVSCKLNGDDHMEGSAVEIEHSPKEEHLPLIVFYIYPFGSLTKEMKAEIAARAAKAADSESSG